MAKKPIFISVTLSARTFRNFAVFHAMNRQGRWKFPIITAVVCFVFSIICYMYQEQISWAGTLGMVLSAITVLVPTLYFQNFYNGIKKQTERMKLTEPRHVYSIELSEATAESIRFFQPGEKYPAETFSWKSIEGAWRTNHAIYIYVSPERALLIPDIIKNVNHDNLWAFLEKQLGTEKMHVSKKRGLLF